MSGLKHPTPLPREVLDLALDRAVPSVSPDLTARQLCDLAERQGGRSWKSIGWLAGRDPLLRGAWIRHDWRSGAPPLAVGSVKCLDRAAGVYWVALDGAALRQQGRALLFGDRQRAMRAATLAAASRCMQQLCTAIASILAKRAENISEDDLPGFDRAMVGFRGAVHLAAADWGGRPIAVPITLEENLTPKARAICNELIDVALNTPAAAMTVQ